ncbi:hypothetical protein [Bradyrhizobium frederickii]|nr:hypothetical protein [Bradyrhizobium frederickii]
MPDLGSARGVISARIDGNDQDSSMSSTLYRETSSQTPACPTPLQSGKPDAASREQEISGRPAGPRPCNRAEPVALFRIAFYEGFNPMNFRALIPSIALAALGLAVTVSVAPAAELALATSHRATAVQGGFVLWDDVYPPAIYGPQLRPVEEVAAMKAQARPVSQRWWGYWYVR